MKHFIAGLLLWLCAAGAVVAQCSEDQVELRGEWGTARFTVAVADTADERSQGLMFVKSMPRSSGMLFVYERPQRAVFWMKNTLIPLDMIFTDDRGRVVHVHHEAIPGDLTGIDGGDNVYAVLEVNGGVARQLGLSVGSDMRHPAFAERDAVWPC